MKTPILEAKDLTLGYGNFIVLNDLNFSVEPGEIFVIMGGSGCGKSTLLRHLIGLEIPKKGALECFGKPFSPDNEAAFEASKKRFGVLFQSGALWSSLTLAENVALPLEQHTALSKKEIRELVALKLRLVGLAGFEGFYPKQLSGGMQKRAGLARALALDPDVLFFDEPAAGLDPLNAHHLDNLILELRASLGKTFIVVTHELQSIFRIADRALFLNSQKRTATALASPKVLLTNTEDPAVVAFLGAY